jgi:hypothetical protein
LPRRIDRTIGQRLASASLSSRENSPDFARLACIPAASRAPCRDLAPLTLPAGTPIFLRESEKTAAKREKSR